MVEPIQKPGRSKEGLAKAARAKYFARVDSSAGASACWAWRGAHVCGYGWFYLGGGRASSTREYAHRLALYYATGKWGVVAMHSCDNRGCCNPAHLAWGSHSQNSQDALAKGREYLGEANSNSVMTSERVREMRALRADGSPLAELAALFGCTKSNVSAICLRKSWNHV